MANRLRLVRVLVVSWAVAAAACGEASPPTTVRVSDEGVRSTTTSSTAAPVGGSTTAVDLVDDEFIPVGGDEYHDSMQTGSAAQRLFNDVVEARDSGDLRLDTIDMYWVQGLALFDERENLDVAEEVMALLAEERDARLADLPDPIVEYRDLITTAIVVRDFDSRAAAYEVLDEVIKRGGDLGSDANTVYGLQYQLEAEVKGELIRREALAGGTIGPELDPSDLPPLPDRLLLVQWSYLDYSPDLVVLVDLDGDPLGYLDGHTLRDAGRMTIANGKVVYEASYNERVQAGEGEECVVSYQTVDRTYLICDDTTSYSHPARAAEVRVEYSDGTIERIGGAGYAYPESDPEFPVVGHWAGVYPNPDGSAVLGQWSGECEIPTVHMIYQGEVTAGAGRTDDVTPESYALGWRDDGLAVVAVTGGLCSSDYDNSGVYTWSPQGELEPLYLTTSGGIIARLISPNDPLPD